MDLLKKNKPYNIPASRFLRPYSSHLKYFEILRLNRIRSAMTYAARHNLIYHLWWHPHNFGVNQNQNFKFLNRILEHYSKLEKKYKFQSLSMSGLASDIEMNEMNEMNEMKIIIIGGKRSSVNLLYNKISTKHQIQNVIIENGSNYFALIKRRISKLGIVTVLGQILFQIFIMKFLKYSSKKRIKQIIIENNLDVSKIEKELIINIDSVNSTNTIELINRLKPDLIVINGTRILSNNFINNAPCKIINIHAGITPKYRGMHGVYWALVNNDSSNSGVTVHFVDKGIDTGDIIYQSKVNPEKKDNFSTYPLLQLATGLEILLKAIDDIKNNSVVLIKKKSASRLYFHPTIWQYFYYRFLKNIK